MSASTTVLAIAYRQIHFSDINVKAVSFDHYKTPKWLAVEQAALTLRKRLNQSGYHKDKQVAVLGDKVVKVKPGILPLLCVNVSPINKALQTDIIKLSEAVGELVAGVTYLHMDCVGAFLEFSDIHILVPGTNNHEVTAERKTVVRTEVEGTLNGRI